MPPPTRTSPGVPARAPAAGTAEEKSKELVAKRTKLFNEFARSKGKPMSLPEWGMWERSDRHGGGERRRHARRDRRDCGRG